MDGAAGEGDEVILIDLSVGEGDQLLKAAAIVPQKGAVGQIVGCLLQNGVENGAVPILLIHVHICVVADAGGEEIGGGQLLAVTGDDHLLGAENGTDGILREDLGLHKLCLPLLRRIPNKWFVRILSWTITFVFLNITWVFFRANSMETAWNILQQAALNLDWAYLCPFVIARPMWTLMVLLVMIMHIVPERRYSRIRTRFIYAPWYVKFIIVLLVLQLVVQFHTNSVQPFIYSQF